MNEVREDDKSEDGGGDMSGGIQAPQKILKAFALDLIDFCLCPSNTKITPAPIMQVYLTVA